MFIGRLVLADTVSAGPSDDDLGSTYHRRTKGPRPCPGRQSVSACMPQMRKNGLAHGSLCRRVREMAGLRGKTCRVGSQTRLQCGNAANASRGAPTLFRRNQAVIRRPGGARVRGTRTYSAGAAGDNRGQSPLKSVQQAGTAFAGAGEGLFVLPGLDELGIAGEQDVRDLPAVELGGTGIDGRGDQAVLEAVGQG